MPILGDPGRESCPFPNGVAGTEKVTPFKRRHQRLTQGFSGDYAEQVGIAMNSKALKIGLTTVALVLLVLTFGVWLARFAGYFGGPVPVTTLRAWLAS